MARQVRDEHRTLDGGFADRHRRKEGAGTAKGDTVPQESTDAMQVKARGVHGFGGVTDVVINVQGVEACQLAKRDVVDQSLPSTVTLSVPGQAVAPSRPRNWS